MVNSVKTSTALFSAEAMSPNVPEVCSITPTSAPASIAVVVAPPEVLNTSKATMSPPVLANLSMFTRITASSSPLAIAPVI